MAEANVKPFEQVSIGDRGEDYGMESGRVIAKGTYDKLKEYDSTGACDELEELSPEQMNEMVAVLMDFEDDEDKTILWCYGADGFAVYEGGK